jgi:hypothetical protein
VNERRKALSGRSHFHIEPMVSSTPQYGIHRALSAQICTEQREGVSEDLLYCNQGIKPCLLENPWSFNERRLLGISMEIGKGTSNDVIARRNTSFTVIKLCLLEIPREFQRAPSARNFHGDRKGALKEAVVEGMILKLV